MFQDFNRMQDRIMSEFGMPKMDLSKYLFLAMNNPDLSYSDA